MPARLLIRDLAVADGTSSQLQVGIGVLVEDGRIAWIGPTAEADPGGADILDGGGATLVPALVDAHSHLTGPGGSHWIERFSDPPASLRQVARENARRLVQAGILWARDVGAPSADGRPVSLAVRDEMLDQIGQPYIRAAGTWLAKTGYLSITIQVDDGQGLLQAAMAQLDAGADFVKIMLDAPAGEQTAPFSVDEVSAVVRAVHARGKKITSHATITDGARVAAASGVDSVEHGFALDADIARTMAANNVALVSTLSVFASTSTFARTTLIDRFIGEAGQRRNAERRERAFASIDLARRAGVRIATGSDFGGGSVRAGHLAWEIELLVEAGMQPWEALGAATWRGGELLGEPHAGRIGAGNPADFVLVHGDPLSDPRACWRVWAVFQRGVRVA
ncbi:MAG TPA: amidohydrolase family protein [Chloroflexota bacterium]|jgi:imidazolonepropionase-like amidohydrolase|nr:amidohydrolase family protein [Chloroflexota bacterium]